MLLCNSKSFWIRFHHLSLFLDSFLGPFHLSGLQISNLAKFKPVRPAISSVKLWFGRFIINHLWTLACICFLSFPFLFMLLDIRFVFIFVSSFFIIQMTSDVFKRLKNKFIFKLDYFQKFSHGSFWQWCGWLEVINNHPTPTLKSPFWRCQKKFEFSWWFKFYWSFLSSSRSESNHMIAHSIKGYGH